MGSDETSATRGRVCLWFDRQGEDAARFYVAALRGGSIGRITRYLDPDPSPAGRGGEVMTVEFTVEGIDFVALNGGPQFVLDEAFSVQVLRDTQAELDETWDALLEGGGVPTQCGWLRDRFGVSWQEVPTDMADLIRADDGSPSRPAIEAMLGIEKLDIEALRRARAGG
jgi:predicted 3-demethylubiquinone-9 3-methyltransferase (glyoxalase superfamily)